MCITKCWFFYFNLVQFWKRSVALFFTILNMNVLFINVKYRKAQTNWPCITWHSLRPFFAVLVCCRVFEDLFRCEQITWFTDDADLDIVATQNWPAKSHILLILCYLTGIHERLGDGRHAEIKNVSRFVSCSFWFF